ncbi:MULTISPECIES: esterase-like activity of phytase family protein [unclassified Amycolatopsis]|uniref:esterase-like activity of phytase family protein n=1 Tax=unclassified Amycolatopsis TaxID=2618356 RepID=UPI0014304C94|nr:MULTISPECIES: esterase-like activity of phytase family protein [unclassified Amycolatopsis]
MRVVLALTAVLMLAGAVPAAAAPAPETLCQGKDKRLNELSGLASDGEHWYAINDGGTKVQVFVLDRKCQVTDVLTDSTDPYDVEDLARGKDGTLWLSDTGDNRAKRETIALLELKPTGGPAVVHRLTYPDGPHDTETLVLDQSGTPFLVTKDLLGTSKVYRPSAPLATPGPTKLEQVGTLRVHSTDTPGGPVGSFGSALITGGATSADGKVIALRTYTDAYLYAAPDGDVAAALQREPVRIPLPNEKQGEAIAFEPDGTLLSASEGVGEPVRAIKNATSLVTPQAPAPKPGGVATPQPAEQESGGFPVVPAAAIAAVVVLGAWFLLARKRRRA